MNIWVMMKKDLSVFITVKNKPQQTLTFMRCFSNSYCHDDLLFRKAYPSNTIIHHQICRGPYSPSITPFAVKLETYNFTDDKSPIHGTCNKCNIFTQQLTVHFDLYLYNYITCTWIFYICVWLTKLNGY